MPKRLSSSKSIILLRFHKDFEVVKERVRILKHFDPKLPVYGLFGGKPEDYKEAVSSLQGLTENVWNYQSSKDNDWKWMHSDLIQKVWFRDVGHKIDFDFMFSYEYDLLNVVLK